MCVGSFGRAGEIDNTRHIGLLSVKTAIDHSLPRRRRERSKSFYSSSSCKQRYGTQSGPALPIVHHDIVLSTEEISLHLPPLSKLGNCKLNVQKDFEFDDDSASISIVRSTFAIVGPTAPPPLWFFLDVIQMRLVVTATTSTTTTEHNSFNARSK